MTRNQISFLTGFFTGLLLAAFIFAGFNYAKAGHGLYDPVCCDDRDCRPVPPGFIKWVPDCIINGRNMGSGYYMADTEQCIPEYDANGDRSWRIKQSRDQQNHVCRLKAGPMSPATTPKSRTLCIYIAPSGN